MTKLQQSLLDLMQEIHEKFEEHNIKYSLAGGTLLGAIREKGFIPWDDDIDILVKQEQLEKIFNIDWPDRIKIVSYREGLFNLYKIIDTRYEYKTKTGTTPLFIDLFFLSSLETPKYLPSRNKYLKLASIIFSRKRYWTLYLKDKRKTKWLQLPLLALLMAIPKFTIRGKFKRQLKSNGEFFATPNWDDSAYTQNWIFKQEQISEFVLHKFEDKEFYVYKNFEEHLVLHFGKNWSTPIKFEGNIHSVSDVYEVDKLTLPKDLKLI